MIVIFLDKEDLAVSALANETQSIKVKNICLSFLRILLMHLYHSCLLHIVSMFYNIYLLVLELISEKLFHQLSVRVLVIRVIWVDIFVMYSKTRRDPQWSSQPFSPLRHVNLLFLFFRYRENSQIESCLFPIGIFDCLQYLIEILFCLTLKFGAIIF